MMMHDQHKVGSQPESEFRKQFVELCKMTKLVQWESLDTFQYEPYLVELLMLSKKRLEVNRNEVVATFVDVLLGNIEASDDTIEFCMRDLRLPEVLDALFDDMERTYGTPYYTRRMNYWSHIQDAYNDIVFEGATFWQYYIERELHPSKMPYWLEQYKQADYHGKLNIITVFDMIGPVAKEVLTEMQQLRDEAEAAKETTLASKWDIIIQTLNEAT